MTKPLSAAAFLKALRGEGVKVVEVDGWRTHNRNHKGAWGPVHGVMLHHTGQYSSEQQMVDLCRTGYASLPGPLCHGVIDRSGTVHLVGYGRANHAGRGDDDVLDAVIAEKKLPVDNEANTDGNARFYGFEAINAGNGEDWPPAQEEAMVRVSAAVLRAHGWNVGGAGAMSVIGHKEWQPGKPDPAGINMNGLRERVAARLRHKASWNPQEDKMALTDEDAKKVAKAVWAHMADNVLGDDPAKLTMERRSWGNTARLARVEKALKAQAATIDKLVDAISAGTGTDVEALKAEIREAIESVTVRLEVEG